MHQGERAKELREERGWTQEELRERLERVGRKMTRPNISLMERREWLEGEFIQDLSRVFGISPASFFDTEVVAPSETREEVIERAFQFVVKDPDFRGGSSAMARSPLEAKLYLVRLYERMTHRKLLPDEVV